VVEGFSAREIAEEIFSSKMAVLNGLKRFGIPIREPHQHHGHPSQPRYGTKFKRNHLIDFKNEQRVIRVVKELRAKGLSLRQITKFLNEMNVATKYRRRGWHPEMIRRILNFSGDTDN
jgi:IS30 family transposase